MKCVTILDQRSDGSLILRDYDDNIYNVDNIVEAIEVDERLFSELHGGCIVASSVSENIDDIHEKFSSEYHEFLKAQGRSCC